MQEALVAIMMEAIMWQDGLFVADTGYITDHAWPVILSEVSISSELSEEEDHFLEGPTSQLLNRHAPSFVQLARQILGGMPLPWKTKPRTLAMTSNGEERFAKCELLESHSTRNGSPAAAAQRDAP